jgi:hypothetical protein
MYLMNTIKRYNQQLEIIKNNPIYKLQNYLLEQVKEKHIVNIIFDNLTDLYQLEYDNYQKDPENNKISEMCIREFQDKVDWEKISKHKKLILSECFIREFQDKVDWELICYRQKLSEDFIREFQDKVDWNGICYRQKLSEDFIREFQDKVDWDLISVCQNLSDDFIREFQDKICF